MHREGLGGGGGVFARRAPGQHLAQQLCLPRHLTLCYRAQRPLFSHAEGLGSGGVVFAWSGCGALLAAAAG